MNKLALLTITALMFSGLAVAEPNIYEWDNPQDGDVVELDSNGEADIDFDFTIDWESNSDGYVRLFRGEGDGSGTILEEFDQSQQDLESYSTTVTETQTGDYPYYLRVNDGDVVVDESEVREVTVEEYSGDDDDDDSNGETDSDESILIDTQQEWLDASNTFGGVTPYSTFLSFDDGATSDQISLGYADGYNEELDTDQRPNAFMSSGSSPILQYRFDDGSVADYSGNDYDGTIEGSPEPVDGIWGVETFGFDGSNDYIDTGVSPQDLGISTTDSFAVSLWSNADSWDDGHRFFGARHDSGSKDRAWISGRMSDEDGSNELDFWIRDDNSDPNRIVTTDADVSLNEWTHIVFVAQEGTDEDGMNIYVDGQEVDTTATHDDLSSSVEIELDFYLAEENVDGSPLNQKYDGDIDEFMFFDQELTESDVEKLYMDKGQEMTAGANNRPLMSTEHDLGSEEYFLESIEIDQELDTGDQTFINIEGFKDDSLVDSTSLSFDSGDDGVTVEDIDIDETVDFVTVDFEMINDGNVESSPSINSYELNYNEEETFEVHDFVQFNPQDGDELTINEPITLETDVFSNDYTVNDAYIEWYDSGNNLVTTTNYEDVNIEPDNNELLTKEFDDGDVLNNPDDYEMVVEVVGTDPDNNEETVSKSYDVTVKEFNANVDIDQEYELEAVTDGTLLEEFVQWRFEDYDTSNPPFDEIKLDLIATGYDPDEDEEYTIDESTIDLIDPSEDTLLDPYENTYDITISTADVEDYDVSESEWVEGEEGSYNVEIESVRIDGDDEIVDANDDINLIWEEPEEDLGLLQTGLRWFYDNFLEPPINIITGLLESVINGILTVIDVLLDAIFSVITISANSLQYVLMYHTSFDFVNTETDETYSELDQLELSMEDYIRANFRIESGETQQDYFTSVWGTDDDDVSFITHKTDYDIYEYTVNDETRSVSVPLPKLVENLGVPIGTIALFNFALLIYATIVRIMPDPVVDLAVMFFEIVLTVWHVFTFVLFGLNNALRFLFNEGLQWTLYGIYAFAGIKFIRWSEVLWKGASDDYNMSLIEASEIVMNDIKGLYLDLIELAHKTYDIGSKAISLIMDGIRTLIAKIPVW